MKKDDHRNHGTLRRRKSNFWSTRKHHFTKKYKRLLETIQKEYTKEGDLNLASIKPCRINYIRLPLLVSKSLHIWGSSAITDAERSEYYERDESQFYTFEQVSDIRTISFELFLYTCWKSNENTKQINIISMFNNMDRDDYRHSGINFVEENHEKELWNTASINLKPHIQIKINYLLLEIEDNKYLPASLLYPLYMKLSFRPNKQTIVHCCCGLGRTSWVITSLEFLRNIQYKKKLVSILQSKARQNRKILKEKGLAFFLLLKSFISKYATELLKINSVFYTRMNILIYMIARKYTIQRVHLYDNSPNTHLTFISLPYHKIHDYLHDSYMPIT